MRTCVRLLTGLLLTVVAIPRVAAALSVGEPPSRGTVTQQPAFLNTSSRHVVALVGQTAHLHCDVQHLGDRSVVWVRKGDLHILTVGVFSYTSDSRFSVLYTAYSQRWTLRLQQARLSDSDMYSCQVSYEPPITHDVRLQVVEELIWWDQENAPPYQNPVVGGSALIKCVPGAHSPVIVKWYHKDGVPISDDHRFTQQSDGLHIENVSVEDNGEYVCRAMLPSQGALAERRITVEVHSRPEIVVPQPGAEVTLTEGQEGSIQCQVTGIPPPHITWSTSSGTPAELEPGLDVDGNGTLLFRPAGQQMAGEYRCRADNVLGSAESTVQVAVIGRPHIVRYGNTTSREGVSASLECHASGSPPLAISFRKADSNTSFEEGVSPGDGRVMVQQRQEDGQQVGVLTIGDVVRADAGLYECVASNADGRAAALGRLTIQHRPRLTGPTVVLTPTGQTAGLHCRAEAVPHAHVTWQMTAAWSRAEAPPQQTRDGDTAVLMVTPTESRHYGVYTCTATNRLGSSSLSIALRESTVPAPVSGITVQEVTPTSVVFSVAAPASGGGLPVTSYRTQFGQPGQRVFTVQTWAANSPSFSVDGLTPAQTYRFRFAAENEAGRSEWSEELQVEMPQISVPESPLIVTEDGVDVTDGEVHSRQTDSYRITWQAPADNGLVIDSYQISVHRVVRLEDEWRADSAALQVSLQAGPDHRTSYYLTNLQSASTYRLELRAVNRLGTSRPALLLVHTAETETASENGSAGTEKSAPQLSVMSKQIVANTGTTAELKCSIQPAANASQLQTWTKMNSSGEGEVISFNDIMLSRDPRFSTSHITDGPKTTIRVLKIAHVREEDQGTYRCQYHAAGASLSDTTLLNVRPTADSSGDSLKPRPLKTAPSASVVGADGQAPLPLRSDVGGTDQSVASQQTV